MLALFSCSAAYSAPMLGRSAVAGRSADVSMQLGQLSKKVSQESNSRNGGSPFLQHTASASAWNGKCSV